MLLKSNLSVGKVDSILDNLPLKYDKNMIRVKLFQEIYRKQEHH